VLHHRIDGAFGGRVSVDRPDRGARRERGQEHDTATLPENRQKLLHKKERRAHIDGEQTIEILDSRLFDRGRLRDAGVRDEDVQSIADNGANLSRQYVRSVGRGQIGADGVGSAAGMADFLHYSCGSIDALPIVNEHLRAGFRHGERAGPADAARSPCDERRFPREIDHDRSP